MFPEGRNHSNEKKAYEKNPLFLCEIMHDKVAFLVILFTTLFVYTLADDSMSFVDIP